MVTKQPTLFDEVLDFLASAPTQAEIAAFAPSETLQLRARTLLDKNRTSALTAEEHAELDAFSEMNHVVSMLKRRVRNLL